MSEELRFIRWTGIFVLIIFGMMLVGLLVSRLIEAGCVP